jgi:hypothetical protein
VQERLEEHRIESMQLLTEPASAGDAARHIEALGLAGSQREVKAHLDDEQGMLKEEGAQLRHIPLLFTDLDEKRFEIGACRVRTRARHAPAGIVVVDGSPIEQGKELAVAVHEGIMVEQASAGGLVKERRVWYHG